LPDAPDESAILASLFLNLVTGLFGIEKCRYTSSKQFDSLTISLFTSHHLQEISKSGNVESQKSLIRISYAKSKKSAK
jgi:hypothetical protein